MMLLDARRFDFDSDDEEDRYESLVGPKGHWKTRRDLQLGILADLGLAPEHRFLDLGCGALRVGLTLIDYLDRANYVGIDIDEACVRAANELIARFALRGREPLILQSAAFGLDVLPHAPQFDRIWCFQVFIHLTEDLMITALRAIKTFLREDGVAWISVCTNEKIATFESYGAWRAYVLNHAPLAWYGARAADAGLTLEEVGIVVPDGLVQREAKRGSELRLLALRHAG